MFFKGFKIRITGIFFVLLLLGMLLANIVATLFWQRYLINLAVKNSKNRLTHFVIDNEQLCQKTNDPTFIENRIKNYRFLSQSLAISTGERIYPAGDPIDKDMDRILKRASLLNTEIVEHIGHFISVYGVQVKKLVLARPVENCGQIDAVGISTDVEGVSRGFADKQSIIFVYILVNGIILTTIWFFRVRKIIFEPLDGLVRMSESFGIESSQLIQSSNKKNEFGQLATSLKSMFSRIEKDKEKLEKTVNSLEDANRQIIENQDKLIDTEKFAAVGRLSAGLAHEIGNPLGIIQGYLELLGREDIDPADREQYTKRANKELERMTALLHQLLDYSRKKREDQSRTSVGPVIYELVEMIKHQKDTKNILFEIKCDDFAEQVFCGEADLHQVLLNCILNSIDAINERRTRQGNIRISCRVKTIDKQKYAKIEIRDNGIGVKGDDIGSVFDPFFTTKDIGRGTGLGLSVSRSIIENCGGSIHLEKDDVAGALVVILMPVE